MGDGGVSAFVRKASRHRRCISTMEERQKRWRSPMRNGVVSTTPDLHQHQNQSPPAKRVSRGHTFHVSKRPTNPEWRQSTGTYGVKEISKLRVLAEMRQTRLHQSRNGI